MKEAEWTENRLQGEGERKEALKEKNHTSESKESGQALWGSES